MTVQLGIIGFGRHIQRCHLKNYLLDTRVTLVGYYDTEEKPELKLQFFDSISDLLRRVDAVVIGSRDECHADQLRVCVNEGKHVFVEKPLAVNRAQLAVVRSALSIARAKNLIVSTCHPLRFDPPIVWLKHHLENGPPVAEFKFIFHYPKPVSPRRQHRSLMLGHVCHEYDLLRHLFPDQRVISAACIHDSATRYKVEGRTESMAFSFEGNRVLPGKTHQEFVEIQQNTGYSLINVTDGRVFYYDGSDAPIGAKNFDVMFTRVDTDFIDAVHNRRAPYISLDRILEVVSFGITMKRTLS